jgi:hypothetical protein
METIGSKSKGLDLAQQCQPCPHLSPPPRIQRPGQSLHLSSTPQIGPPALIFPNRGGTERPHSNAPQWAPDYSPLVPDSKWRRQLHEKGKQSNLLGLIIRRAETSGRLSISKGGSMVGHEVRQAIAGTRWSPARLGSPEHPPRHLTNTIGHPPGTNRWWSQGTVVAATLDSRWWVISLRPAFVAFPAACGKFIVPHVFCKSWQPNRAHPCRVIRPAQIPRRWYRGRRRPFVTGPHVIGWMENGRGSWLTKGVPPGSSGWRWEADQAGPPVGAVDWIWAARSERCWAGSGGLSPNAVYFFCFYFLFSFIPNSFEFKFLIQLKCKFKFVLLCNLVTPSCDEVI